VRELARDILRASGYTVFEARNGNEALLISERHQGRSISSSPTWSCPG
jgi:CheY-like chemotaxis protein